MMLEQNFTKIKVHGSVIRPEIDAWFRKVRQGGNLQGGKDNFYVAWVFALELKLSKTLSGLVYSVLQL